MDDKLTLDNYKKLLEQLRDLKKAESIASRSLKDFEKDFRKTFEESLVQHVGSYTIVELFLGNYSCVGISKKDEYDNEDLDLGYLIARGRAEDGLLDKINGVNRTHKHLFID